MATSLSEIANIKGDADLAQGGFGTDAVLPENNTALAYLANAANIQAGANKYLAEVHNQRQQDYLTNFNNIDLKNLAPGDYGDLQQQYVDLSKDIADNYDVIQNPLKNPQLAASLRAREAALRGQISQSQMDVGLMGEHNKFLQVHPDWNNAENQKKIQDYYNAPLGKRQPFQLTAPSIFDIPGIADKAYKNVQQKYATATTDGKYIWKKEGIKAAIPEYLAAADSHLSDQDATGRTNRQLLTNAFNQLSPDDQAKFDNNPLKWYHTQILAQKVPDQETKADVDADQYGTIKAQGAESRKTVAMQEGLQAGENEKKYQHDLVLAGLKQYGNGKIDPNAIGPYKNKIYHDMLTGAQSDRYDPAHPFTAPNTTNPNVPNESLQDIYGDNDLTEKTHGDKNLAGGETKYKVKKITVIGNRMSNDNVMIERFDNNNNRILPPLYRTPEQFYNDLNNINGTKNASQVDKASREWNQKNLGKPKPDIDQLKNYFNPQGAVSPSSGTQQTNDPLGILK